MSERKHYIVVLAVVAVLILVGGSLLRSKTDRARAQDPSDAELARLARAAERRAIEDQANYLAEAAERAATSIVYVPASGASGVVWRPGRLLTVQRAGTRLPEGLSIETRAGSRHVTIADRSPGVEVVSAAAPDIGVNPVTPGSAIAGAGRPILAVWQTSDGLAFRSGHLTRGTPRSSSLTPGKREERIRSTIALTAEMVGGGLFDLDGNWLGLIVPGVPTPVAYTPDAVEALLAEAASAKGQVADRSGLRVDSLDAEAARTLGVNKGVLIREVWEGSPAALVGIRPGDVILRMDGREVDRPQDLDALGARESRGRFTLEMGWHRVRRTVVIDSTSTWPQTSAANDGILWGTAGQGQLVQSVAAGSRAERAGVQPGDWIVAVNRVAPSSLSAVRRLLASPPTTPVFLEIRRAGYRWGTVF